MLRIIIIISTVFLQFILSVNCNPSVNVIIVGAGPAGIAAASKLAENNFTNFKILEAEGRIGGRINSVKFGDAVIDLGAEWCHGENNNKVYELVKDLDLLEKGVWSENFYHSSRKHIDQDFINDIVEMFNGFHYEILEHDGEISIGDYLISKYNESIIERYGNDQEKLKLASEFLIPLSQEILATNGLFSWFSASAKSDWEQSEGDQTMNWKGRGYKTILDVLMKTYPDPQKQLFNNDKIILNKEVTKIQWDKNVVLIKCLDNSTYEADHVIFTPSLGVLKERYDTLFNPQLPQEKIDAIKELGIDGVAKIFLHFPQKWWTWHEDKVNSSSFIWAEQDRLQLLQTFSNVPDEAGLHRSNFAACCR